MCPWCAGDDNYDPYWSPPADNRKLCWAHLAEYHGLSEDGLDRMYREESLDQA